LTDASGINRKQLLQIIVVSLGVFLSSLDVSLNVALPDISEHFGSAPETTYLMIIFYLGTTVGLQLCMGRAGDIYGLRKIFLMGLIAYTLSMIAIGIAQSIELAIGFRVLQAVGNSALLTISPALITSFVQPNFRGRALGVMGGIGSMGMIVGTLLSGLALEYLSWNWIFLGRLPICLIAISGGVFILREKLVEDSKISPNLKTFDLGGALLIFVTLVTFVLFLKLVTASGLFAVNTLFTLIVSLIGGWIFYRRQKDVDDPLLNLNIMRNTVLLGGFCSNLFLYMGSFVNLFILPYYVSLLLQASAFQLGVLLFLNAVFTSMFSPIGGFLADRFGAGLIATSGMLITALTLLSYLMLFSDSSILALAIRMTLVGIGIGLFQSSNLSLVMGQMRQDSLGAGGAISSMSRNLGAVTAVTVLGWVFTSIYSSGSPGVQILNVISTTGSISSFMTAFYTSYFLAAFITILGLISSFVAWRSSVRIIS